MKTISIYSSLFLLFISCGSTSNTNPIKDSKLCKPIELRVSLDDPAHTITNIHRIPAGDVVAQLKIDDQNYAFFIYISTAQNGWFKVTKIEGMQGEVIVPHGEGWIKSSAISVDTRNYEGEQLDLLDKPVNGKKVFTFQDEKGGLKLKDMCGDWVQVEYNESIGWIENKWLCGNSLTNCSYNKNPD